MQQALQSLCRSSQLQWKLLDSGVLGRLWLRTLSVCTQHKVDGHKVLNFGKHRGLTYAEVAADFPEYGAWVLEAVAKSKTKTALREFASYLEASAGVIQNVDQADVQSGPIRRTQLTEEQARTAERALAGENLFLTGAAGTGKSFLLRYLIQQFECKHPCEVAVTASTGIAAANVGGQTLHSFAGIGLGYGNARSLSLKIKKNEDAVRRWQQAKILVVDEISMLEGSLFEKLEEIARNVRRSEEPFGGLQLLLCGDFLQLPPVPDSDMQERRFCFQTDAWVRCGLDQGVVELVDAVRQASDPGFAAVLDEIRLGKVSWKTQQLLMACHIEKKQPPPDDGIIPTKLYCFNRSVDEENNLHLDQLDGKAMVFKATDEWLEGPQDESLRQTLADVLSKRVPKKLRLKMGAQVVLIKNMNHLGLVNGSRGKIVGFRKDEPLVRFDTGELVRIKQEAFEVRAAGGAVLQRTQLPLKLGWALTVHRAQGLTLSRAELEVDRAFEYGQTYVALSRLTGLDGLWISGKGISRHRTRAEPEALKFYERTASELKSRECYKRSSVRSGR